MRNTHRPFFILVFRDIWPYMRLMQMTSVTQNPKITQLIEYLEGLTQRPALSEVTQQLESFDITTEELGDYVQFHSSKYQRNLIFQNEHFQLICLCWKSGQKSHIHDHAESSCGIKVVTGIISETVFERNSEGYIEPVSTTHFGKGVLGSEDSDIHQISNLQGPDQDLVTIHCYAPPLKKMKVFSLDSKCAQEYQPRNDWE